MPPPRIAWLRPAAPLHRTVQATSRRTVFGFGGASSKRTRRRVWFGAGLVVGGSVLIYAHDARAGIHRWLAIPVLHALTANDPERSHVAAVKVLASPFAPVDPKPDDEVLGFELWGRRFSNPIGLAAGFDKHGEAIDGLLGLGFGYVEIGSVTPEAQEGNPKPRFFRIPETQSVINRYGFNSDGHTVVLSRLRERIINYVRAHAQLVPTVLWQAPAFEEVTTLDPVDHLLSSPNGRDAAIADAIGIPRSLKAGSFLGVNLGKNKTSNPDSLDDYIEGVNRLGPYADVLVINVSSPNTPGLRSMQRRGMLEELLASVVEARNKLGGHVKPAVVVKISPDLSSGELQDVAEAALMTNIDGVIVANTTISRPQSAGNSPVLAEVGGLSGPAVRPLALRALATLYNASEGKIPLIGCGGISTADDAIDFARAGASFVQLYTGLGYQGPGLPRELKDDLATMLHENGKRWSDYIGTAAHQLGTPRATSHDEHTHRLRTELELVLADLAEGRPVSIPLESPADVVAATAGLFEPTDLPLSTTPIDAEVVAPSATHQSTLPVATQTGHPPESGILDRAHSLTPYTPGAIPIVILEDAGVPPPAAGSTTPLPTAKPVLAPLLNAARQQATDLVQEGSEKLPKLAEQTKDAVQTAIDTVRGEAVAPARPAESEGVPLGRLFSTFGERGKAGRDGKRMV